VKRIIGLYSNAYKGLTTKIWLLALTQLINRVGTMVVFFLAVYLHEDLLFDLNKTGVLMACFGLGSICGVFTAGKLIDRIGFYPVMLWSLILSSFMFIVVSFLEDFTFLAIGLFLLSALGEAFRPANMAAVAHFSKPESYTRSLSLNRLAVNLGFAVGPAAGGILATYSYSYIFWADGITSLLASTIVVASFKTDFIFPRKKETLTDSTRSNSAYRDKAFLLFLLVTFFYAAAFFQFFSTMPLYYKEVEMLKETEIGGLMALNGLLVALFEMVMIYKLEKRWTVFNFIALGAAMLIGCYVALIFLGGMAWLIMLTILISFSEMFAMPFMTTYMNSRANSSNRGQYASLYIMSWSAAQVITPILCTQVIAKAGYKSLWIVLAVFSLLVIVILKHLEKKYHSA